MKHESKMTREELIYAYEWALNIGFYFLARDFLSEMKKRGFIKD